MAQFGVELADFPVLEGWEAIAFRPPLYRECFLSESGTEVMQADRDWTGPRLIVRKQEVGRNARPYNAEEMRNLYLGRARLVSGDQSHDVTGHDSARSTVRVDSLNWGADGLRGAWTHLDGSRCEVVD
jgi:hypothetical protein